MIIIVDEREAISGSFVSWFSREGIAAAGLCAADFEGWVRTVSDDDMSAIEAVLLGECQRRYTIPRMIKSRSQAAVIALNDDKSLPDTLDLFAAGVDDVVRKPVHVRELLARIKAIRTRSGAGCDTGVTFDRLTIHFDGRDPEVDGEVLSLPRRERRILEFLASNPGRLVTKAQIFNSVYGLFDKEVDENVIESHISKLRKRLRNRLEADPIESQRFLGYRLVRAGERSRRINHLASVAHASN